MWRARRNGLFTRTTDTNLDYVFVENAIVFIDPKIVEERPSFAFLLLLDHLGLFHAKIKFSYFNLCRPSEPHRRGERRRRDPPATGGTFAIQDRRRT